MTLAAILDAGTPTGVGSLPFDDAAVAASVTLSLHPELPAAPQLPRRNPREGMLAQVAVGLPGVAVGDDGAIAIDRRRFGPVDDGAPLCTEAWAGTLAFLDACAGRTAAIKVQLTGPVTLGLAFVDAGARASRAFEVAAATVKARVASLVAAVHERSPGAPVVAVLDEPSLTRATHPGFPLVPEDTVDLLSGGLASATAAGAAFQGVHCCGPVDWSLVLHAGPDLVSLPASPAVIDDAAGLAVFLDRGGWVAWGVVPTDRPFGDRHDTHWLRLNEVWAGLTAAGCDPVALRTQSLITPACGLAFHDPAQVPTVFRLVREVAQRVQDQAYAARMSVGA
ncbi:MAG TPA: hypothetical protein VF230_15515 [Acidimicrobiales bacterium]